jgi:hypothetical protein
MNNGMTTEDAKCELHQFERNRYFYGKLMTVRDFETEQRYTREHRHLHNQSLHGWGVVCGLTVEPKGGTGNETKVVVKPGVAFDCCGHEIVLAKDQEIDLRDFQMTIGTVEGTGKTVYLCIKYDECNREPVPALANVSTCEEVCQYNRIQEKVAFDILSALPTAPEADPCAIWMNLITVRSEIHEGETVIAEFERSTPFWANPGDVFEVRRKVTPKESGNRIHLIDQLPNGFTLHDGSLEMEIADATEGKVASSTYLVKVANDAPASPPPQLYDITGEALQSPIEELATSTVRLITRPVEEQVRQALFNQQFAQCPHCADDPSSRCVVLASITLRPQDSAFAVGPIDVVTFDGNGIHRRLVYSTTLVVELLECLKNHCMGQGPAQTDVKVDVKDDNIQVVPALNSLNFLGGIDVVAGGAGQANISANVGNGLKIVGDQIQLDLRVQGNDGPVFSRAQINVTGPGVSVSDDAANNRINITVPGGGAVRVFTGEEEVRFDGNGNLVPETVRIAELSTGEPFAVLLAPQLPAGTFPVRLPPLIQDRPGAHFVFGSAPTLQDVQRLFAAFVPQQPYDGTFEIHGFAPRLEGQTIRMVWWVIAGPALRDRIIDFIRNNPNITLARLAEGLGTDPVILQPAVERLVEEGIVRRGPGGRLTLVQP